MGTLCFTREDRISLSHASTDRFYATSTNQMKSECAQPNAFSDHDIVTLEITNFDTPTHGKGYWKNNVGIYEDENFIDLLKRKWNLWRTLHQTLFFDKIMWGQHGKAKIQILSKNYCRLVSWEELEEETQIHEKLHFPWSQLSDSPHLTSKFQQEKERLASFLKTKHWRKLLKARLEYCEHGDRGTKEFYKQFATQKDRTWIKQLANTNGDLISDNQSLLNATRTFYQQLYDNQPIDGTIANDFLDDTQEPLQNTDDSLTKPITEPELHHTIQQMAIGKTPGPDGLSVEFYLRCWNIIGTDFTKV